MNSGIAFTQILILFSILLVGILLRKKKQLSDFAEETMSVLIVKVGLPAMVLASTNIPRTPNGIKDVYILFGLSILYYIGMFLLGGFSAKLAGLRDDSFNVFVGLVTFANVGFMGFPIAKSFYGEQGVFYAAVVNLIFNLTLWTVGILLFNRNEKIHLRKLLSPGTLACILAIFIFLLGLRLPAPVYAALSTMGSMTVPLSMLMIGALIADRDILKAFQNKTLLFMSFIRLLLVPLLTGVILHFFDLNHEIIYIFCILAAMPAGALNAVFAREYNSDKVMASEGIFVSTLLCIGTLPLIVLFLNYILK